MFYKSDYSVYARKHLRLAAAYGIALLVNITMEVLIFRCYFHLISLNKKNNIVENVKEENVLEEV